MLLLLLQVSAVYCYSYCRLVPPHHDLVCTVETFIAYLFLFIYFSLVSLSFHILWLHVRTSDDLF